MIKDPQMNWLGAYTVTTTRYRSSMIEGAGGKGWEGGGGWGWGRDCRCCQSQTSKHALLPFPPHPLLQTPQRLSPPSPQLSESANDHHSTLIVFSLALPSLSGPTSCYFLFVVIFLLPLCLVSDLGFPTQGSSPAISTSFFSLPHLP